jgi:predicted amidohydrolase
MDIDDAESLKNPGRFMCAYQDFASRESCAVAGSIKLEEEGRVYNSVLVIDKGGAMLGAYHKSNLTIGEIEKGLTPGNGAKTFDASFGRIGAAVCFDLNFEWLRKEYAELKPDIIAFSSNYHGGIMQSLWAYECGSFFVSALPFAGGGILDPLGESIKTTDCYSSIARTTINLDRAVVHLDYNRDKFSEIERKYLEKVLIDIPANLGSALIYSLSDEFSAGDIVNEFELELLDDYFARSQKANDTHRKDFS